MTIANLRRAVVAVSVAAGAGIGLGSLLLQPVMPDDPAEFVATLASSPGAGIGMQLFVFSQLFWAIGLVGVGHLASRRAPVLATLGAVLSGLGAFGHAVYGGAMLTQLALASNTDAAVAAVLASETAIFLPYFVGGLGAAKWAQRYVVLRRRYLVQFRSASAGERGEEHRRRDDSRQRPPSSEAVGR